MRGREETIRNCEQIIQLNLFAGDSHSAGLELSSLCLTQQTPYCRKGTVAWRKVWLRPMRLLPHVKRVG